VLALSRSYDLNYWFNGLALADGSSPVLGLAFSRDANGNLSVVNDIGEQVTMRSWAMTIPDTSD